MVYCTVGCRTNHDNMVADGVLIVACGLPILVVVRNHPAEKVKREVDRAIQIHHGDKLAVGVVRILHLL